MGGRLECAVPPGRDPAAHSRFLRQVHEAALAGAPGPAKPRALIEASWRRVVRQGVDPDRGGSTGVLPVEQIEQRRARSRLAEVLPVLRRGLLAVADDAAQIMVVVDAEGRLLWREGSAAVRLRADRLGFVEGAGWDEPSVGTNAIGTAIVVRRPVQVYDAEHFVRSHHAWTCAAAPLRDPRDGRLLGVVDVSGPAATVHASTLALVDAVARLAEAQLRSAHRASLERLRSTAVGVLARVTGPAVVIDPHGWVAAAVGVAPVDRLAVPEHLGEERTWLPALGRCRLEPLPGGWLVRLTDDDPTDPVVPTRVELDLQRPLRPTLRVTGPGGTWVHALSPRHAELLLVLATSPRGRTAAQLSLDLFADAGRTVTVRAEMSRLRRHLGGVIDHRPYRFADSVEVVVARPADDADLLPASTAPAVERLRRERAGGAPP